MRNPFEYGSVVESNAFCNRQRELADLLRSIENGERVFVYAERRMGKTSLVRLLLSKLQEEESYLTTYVDLWPTDSESSFISAFASALTEAATSTPQKMLEFAKSFFSRLAPSVTLDDEGKPQISFGVVSGIVRDIETTLEEILLAPEKIAKRTKKKVVIVFDEFQQLFEYEDDLVERQLRSVIQNQPSVSYIFLGSRKHLIRKMVLDKSRPLYRAGPHYPLGPISKNHWLSFIRSKFETSRRTVSDAQIDAICDETQGHPFYTQHLCHALWELTDEGTTVTQDHIDDALDMLLSREDYAYTALWESLALSQRRVLEGLAIDPEGAKVFGADFLDRYELRSASTAQRAVKALLEKDFIDQESGAFFITDRFFKIWIRRKHA